MTSEQRRKLKEAIDAKKRATVLLDCGDTATPATYNAGCRCKACKAAEAAYRAQRRLAVRGVIETHNRIGYERGCRCQVCVDANGVYHRQRYARQKDARQTA